MKVNRKQAETLRLAIQHWKEDGHLTETTASVLQKSIEIVSFDWKRLAKYSFWIALICIVTSISAIIADRALVEFFHTIFNAPHFVKFIFLSLTSASIYKIGIRRRAQHPQAVFSNEAILFLGVLATAGGIYQLGRALDSGSGHFSLLLLLSFIIYALLGYFFRSNLIWLFSLISLGSWMGTETGYMSGWGAYYLGMNYPLRFVLFGSILIGLALFLEKEDRFQHFFRTTLIMGLLYLFISLWIMSIFGNYGDMDSWYKVGPYELFHWSLIFGAVAGASIYYGLRYENGMAKGFGITFLFINLYTRFFEYFWNASHKAIFFALLGVSFWFLGSRAERIWSLGEGKKEKSGH